MAIPANAPVVYRIVSKANARVLLPAAKITEFVTAMNADVSGQYQLVSAVGNTIIYDWAPKLDTNVSASLALRRAIEWGGLAFSVVSLMLVKGN